MKTIMTIALDRAVREGVYLIKPNVRKFRELLQIKAEARKMIKNGCCEVLIISLDAAGALMVSKDISEHILPPTVPIVSKVGAGDSRLVQNNQCLKMVREDHYPNPEKFCGPIGSIFVCQ
jgi:fructose-1-phosphate kinase PfkB-like protein